MPLYEYQCAKCHKRTEKIENLSGPYLKKCPHCGGKLERTLTAPSIQFKGSGWYVNDYAAKPKGDDSAAAKSESKEAPKESAAKDSAAKESSTRESTAKDTPSKESKEKKPAKKKD